MCLSKSGYRMWLKRSRSTKHDLLARGVGLLLAVTRELRESYEGHILLLGMRLKIVKAAKIMSSFSHLCSFFAAHDMLKHTCYGV